jgi:hypothetical protein
MHLASLFARASVAAISLVLLDGCSSSEEMSEESNDELGASTAQCSAAADIQFKQGDTLEGRALDNTNRDYIGELTFEANGRCKAGIKTGNDWLEVSRECTVGGRCGSRTLAVADAFTFALSRQGSSIRFQLVKSKPVNAHLAVNFGPFAMKRTTVTPAVDAKEPPGTECTEHYQCSPQNGRLAECERPSMPICEHGRCTCSD